MTTTISNPVVVQPPSSNNASLSQQPLRHHSQTQFPLITTLSLPQRIPSTVSPSHPTIHWSHHMALVHNTLIRALSSAYTHAPLVSSSTSTASEKSKVTDFLFFNATIASTIRRHHAVEDDFIFPRLASLTNNPTLFDHEGHEHEAFLPALSAYEEYVTSPDTPQEYSGEKVRALINAFAPSLIEHLHSEIATLLSTHVIENGEDVQKMFEEAAVVASRDVDLAVMGPFLLSNKDNSFRIDGRECDFPGFPREVEEMVLGKDGQEGLWGVYKGAWEFSWSDGEGNPRRIS